MDVLAGFLIVIALVDERRRQAVRRVPHGNHSPAHNLARGLAHAAQAVTNIAAFIVIIARQAHAQGAAERDLDTPLKTRAVELELLDNGYIKAEFIAREASDRADFRTGDVLANDGRMSAIGYISQINIENRTQ